MGKPSRERRRREYRASSRIKRGILHRDGFRCQYCGRSGYLTVDHMIPVAMGGATDEGNLVACCLACNRDKADALPLEYLWVVGPEYKPRPRADRPAVA